MLGLVRVIFIFISLFSSTFYSDNGCYFYNIPGLNSTLDRLDGVPEIQTNAGFVNHKLILSIQELCNFDNDITGFPQAYILCWLLSESHIFNIYQNNNYFPTPLLYCELDLPPPIDLFL